MPELPDVEIFKQYLTATSLHQPIKGILILHKRLVRHVSRTKLTRILKGRQLESVQRHGKILFARLNRQGGWLVFHFGMTGFLHYSQGVSKHDTPHPRFGLEFQNGAQLLVDSTRLFGEVTHTPSMKAYIERKKLGPDALDVTRSVFCNRMKDRKGIVKSTLMNQSVIAGLGNVYSDEILYRARVHPQRSMNIFNKPSLRKLYRAMQTVLHQSIQYGADPHKMPNNWLIHHRKANARCPKCHGPIKRMNIQHRSSYFCGICQPNSR